MQLEDGKTYLNGFGKKVTVTLRQPTDGRYLYPFKGSNKETYQADGKYLLGDHPETDLYNLIEEVEDDASN